MRRKTSLATIAAGMGGATIAGYGLSMGRDLWRSTKKNQGLLIFLIALAGAVTLPVLGARGLVRGHDRGPVATLFFTFLGNLLWIVAGFALAALCAVFISAHMNELYPALSVSVILATVTTGCSVAIGLLWGLIQRPGRVRTIATARANEQFLKSIGFVETGGQDITHYDPLGQPLRFIEAHGDRLVFMAVGKRGKRAYISLGPAGRMTAYSGVV